MQTDLIITPHDEIVSMAKAGDFFGCCVAIALNKGFRDVMNSGQPCIFSIGDYDVEFKKDGATFILCHKVYFARIISASISGTYFVGDSKEDVIESFLIELEKENP